MMPSFSCHIIVRSLPEYLSILIRNRDGFFLGKVLNYYYSLTLATFQNCTRQNLSLGCACQSIRKSHAASAFAAVKYNFVLNFLSSLYTIQNWWVSFCTCKGKGNLSPLQANVPRLFLRTYVRNLIILQGPYHFKRSILRITCRLTIRPVFLRDRGLQNLF